MPTAEIEQHITIAELAEKLSLCVEKTRLMVKDEPGVRKFQLPESKRTFYRIPVSVVDRMLKRVTNV